MIFINHTCTLDYVNQFRILIHSCINIFNEIAFYKPKQKKFIKIISIDAFYVRKSFFLLKYKILYFLFIYIITLHTLYTL